MLFIRYTKELLETAKKLANSHEARSTSDQDVLRLVVNIVDGCDKKMRWKFFQQKNDDEEL